MSPFVARNFNPHQQTSKERESFEQIKRAIALAPSLISPNFDKEFILYTFASETAYVIVLTHKDDNGEEHPIAFMSSNLEGTELKYTPIEI